jgi:hypothetical protein
LLVRSVPPNAVPDLHTREDGHYWFRMPKSVADLIQELATADDNTAEGSDEGGLQLLEGPHRPGAGPLGASQRTGRCSASLVASLPQRPGRCGANNSINAHSRVKK